jgi:hypothetical protein
MSKIPLVLPAALNTLGLYRNSDTAPNPPILKPVMKIFVVSILKDEVILVSNLSKKKDLN